jgi:acetolactate synthase-1/2/3 large subunit
MRVVDVFAELLELEGIDCVFTVPGGTALPILEAISRRAIRVVVAKDESGAAYAADGYAWASGKPGVVVTIGGPGATNALTGLCCSRVQGNPVVLVSGEVASQSMGRGAVQDGSELGLDVLGMSRPATELSVAGSTADKARFALLEAFRRAILRRCPVHVSLPLDVQNARPALPAPRSLAEYRALDVSAVPERGIVQQAALALILAERPALLVGTGGAACAEEIRALAERLGCPVATTCGAKGVFPEDHPLSLGVFSFGSGPLGRAVLLSGVDVLCAVGTRLGEFSSLNFSPRLRPSRTLIQLDRDPACVGRNYSALALSGDTKATLAALSREVEASGAPPRSGRALWFSAYAERYSRVEDEDARAGSAMPIRPERVMAEIERVLPRDAHVVADIGTSCLFVAHYLKLRPPQRSYIPMGFSCMAHPLAASIGVRLGSDRPTLCVTGDAAFLSKGLELHAAVESGLDSFVWIVLSNRGHALVRLGTEKLLGANHGVEAGDFRVSPDAAAIARSVGAFGRRVEHPDDLPQALAEALAAKGPALLDVRVEPDAEPPMADRIQGLKQASESERGAA